MTEESRVERLLRKAEEAADSGETDKADTYLEILHPAIFLKQREEKALRKSFTAESSRGRHL